MAIFVITHKEINRKPVLSSIYRWLMVGAITYRVNDIEYLCDNIGNNISEKNKNFCELTGLYWIRHNREDRIKGIVHYRRFFTTNRWSEKERYFYSEQNILKQLIKYDCIVAERMYFGEFTVAEHFSQKHNRKDLEIVREVIQEYMPEYLDAFDDAMSARYMFPYNMLIASAEIFDAYVDWLFAVLFEVEKRLDIGEYSEYQARVFGFLAERLLNVWIKKNQVHFLEIPVVQFGSSIKCRIKRNIEILLKNTPFWKM